MKIQKLQRNLTNAEYGNKRDLCCFLLSKFNQTNETPKKIFLEFAMREQLYTNAPVSV